MCAVPQGLRHDRSGQLADLLYSNSQTSMTIAHQLIWLLVSESKAGGDDHMHGSGAAAGGGASALGKGAQGIVSNLNLDSLVQQDGQGASAHSLDDDPAPSQGHGFQRQLPGHDSLPARAVALMRRIVETFPPTARALFELQVWACVCWGLCDINTIAPHPRPHP